MLRIHFTGADLARTRLAAAPDPMWELTLSIHQLRNHGFDLALSEWRRQVGQQVQPGRAARMDIDLLLDLNPPVGYFPDFLTPQAAQRGFDVGLEAVLATPGRQIRHDLQMLARHGWAASGVERVQQADGMRTLARSLTRYRQIAIDPIWERIRAAVEADLAHRRNVLATGGVESLLGGLMPTMRWADGVVEIAAYRGDRDLHLAGRGIVLIPGYFKAVGKPLTLADPELPPVLVYPIGRVVKPPSRPGALADLIGRTRAAVLEAAAEGCTTGEVARRLGISPASASQHLTVLREAGMVVSVRDANRVRHVATPLGHALLDSA
jgi:DNA-binding transcriptional ArsR family regulator